MIIHAWHFPPALMLARFSPARPQNLSTHFSSCSSMSSLHAAIELLPDQLLLLFECNPNIIESTKELDSPDRCPVTDIPTLVPSLLSCQPS